MDIAKLYQKGNSQVVRLPENYRFAGAYVYLKKVGNAVVLIPAYQSWQPLIESLELFTGDFMADRVQLPNQPSYDRCHTEY